MAKMTIEILEKIKDYFEAGKFVVNDECKIYKKLNDGTLKEHGSKHQRGYINFWITIDGVQYRTFAHRLIYFLEYGVWDDKKVINHLDRDKSNNHISNLELITQFENLLYSINHHEAYFRPSLLNDKSKEEYHLNDEEWEIFKSAVLKAYELRRGRAWKCPKKRKAK